MAITADQDTLVLNMRCVAAYREGRCAELCQELRLLGIEADAEEIEAHGDMWADAWRIDDPAKHTCFLCEAPTTPGKLCACFNHVKATRYFDVSDTYALERLPEETVVETIVCNRCGQLKPVTANAVRSSKSYVTSKTYHGFKACETCHKRRQAPTTRPEVQAKPQAGHGHGKRRDKRHQPRQPVQAQPPVQPAPQAVLHQTPVGAPLPRRQDHRKPHAQPLKHHLQLPKVAEQILSQEVSATVTAGDA